jgi:2-oxoglutarate ferredoxin oxidoreductase subunit alpha
MSEHLHKGGGMFLQAESEIGAMNMMYGCSATGTRCMTSSSSPGVSLKTEGISYMVGADLPCVLVSVQRGGPGLGTIQPSQADYSQATKALGHGDMCVPVFVPYSVQEMVDLTADAFALADEYRTPVVILIDGLLGQMMEPVSFDNIAETKTAATFDWATDGHDGKREKRVITSLRLHPEELEEAVNERAQRLEGLKTKHTRAQAVNCDDAEIVVVAYGTSARVIQSAMEMARAEGLKVGTFRPITANPFPVNELKAACKTAKKVLVVEMSMGQMIHDVKTALEFNLPVEFYGRQGGFVPGPQEILTKIKEMGGAN